MGLEKHNEQHYREVVDKYVNPNADYTMSTRDYVVRPSAHLAGPITITLPKVSEAEGRWYSIVVRAASGVNTVTLEDNDNDSECWDGDYTFNAKCDRALCYSDGLKWYVFTGVCAGASTTGPPGTATATSAAPTTVAQTSAAPTTLAPTTA